MFSLQFAVGLLYRDIYYYYYYCYYYYYYSTLRTVFTIIDLKQTMFLGYNVAALLPVRVMSPHYYSACIIEISETFVRLVFAVKVEFDLPLDELRRRMPSAVILMYIYIYIYI